jgi:hypothetical protein
MGWRSLAVGLSALTLLASPALGAPTYVIREAGWSKTDERDYGDFIATIGAFRTTQRGFRPARRRQSLRRRRSVRRRVPLRLRRHAGGAKRKPDARISDARFRK